jgi:hypothetical protein
LKGSPSRGYDEFVTQADMRTIGPVLVVLFIAFGIFVCIVTIAHKSKWQNKADELGDVKCEACGFVGRLKVMGAGGDTYLACPECTSRNFKKV